MELLLPLSQDQRLVSCTFPPKSLVPPAYSLLFFVHTVTPFQKTPMPHFLGSSCLRLGGACQQGGSLFGKGSGENSLRTQLFPNPLLLWKYGPKPKSPATQLTVCGEESSPQQQRPLGGGIHALDTAPTPQSPWRVRIADTAVSPKCSGSSD